MPLTCECYYDGSEGFDWYFERPEDYSTLKTKRRKRCCSCKNLIDTGTVCLEFTRYRHPGYDSIEERIYGEGAEVPLASWFVCEKCADIYFSLEELGFCIDLGESMQSLLEEYRINYGPKERCLKFE
jgi:hypothetical protein